MAKCLSVRLRQLSGRGSLCRIPLQSLEHEFVSQIVKILSLLTCVIHGIVRGNFTAVNIYNCSRFLRFRCRQNFTDCSNVFKAFIGSALIGLPFAVLKAGVGVGSCSTFFIKVSV